MIIYLCMKYESYSPMFSKDIARTPFFIRRSRAITLIIIGWFYPLSNLTCILWLYTCVWNMNPFHQCIQKIWPGNHFSYVRDRTYGTYVCTYVRTDVRTRVMLYAPPIINGGGIKSGKIWNGRLLQITGGNLWVKSDAHISLHSRILLRWRQTLWTPMQQSDLGPYCLQYKLLKYIY